MKSKYCSNCGSPAALTANFCGDCGNAFAGVVKPKQQEIINDIDNDEDNHESNEIVPEIETLEVEINKVESRGVKFQNVIQEALANPTPNVINRPQNKISKKKALEQFKQEAGNIKKSINVGGEH